MEQVLAALQAYNKRAGSQHVLVLWGGRGWALLPQNLVYTDRVRIAPEDIGVERAICDRLAASDDADMVDRS